MVSAMIRPMRPPFAPQVLDGVIEAISWAYAVNREHHDPEIGHDEGSFGYLLYKSITHRLPIVLASSDLARVELIDGAAVVIQGDARLRVYRTGTSEFDDPWTSFPSNRGAAPTMASINSQQLRLFPEFDRSVPFPGGLEFIVSHFGTAATGFRAAYLCLPVGVADDRVRRWAWLTQVFRVGDLAAARAAEELPVAVPIPPTPVRLRPLPEAAPGASDER